MGKFYELNKFLKSLHVKEPTNEAQSRGKAYHMIIENGGEPYEFMSQGRMYYKVYEKDFNMDWVFTKRAVEPALALRRAFPPMSAHEVWSKWEGLVGGYSVIMNMRVDMLSMQEIHEFKTTTSNIRVGNFYASMQWRCYLMNYPTARGVVYHLFKLTEDCMECSYDTLPIRGYSPELAEEEVKIEIHSMLNWLEVHHPAYLKYLEVDTSTNQKQ